MLKKCWCMTCQKNLLNSPKLAKELPAPPKDLWTKKWGFLNLYKIPIYPSKFSLSSWDLPFNGNGSNLLPTFIHRSIRRFKSRKGKKTASWESDFSSFTTHQWVSFIKQRLKQMQLGEGLMSWVLVSII